MAAGVVRIIEVCFVLQDGPSDSNNIRILQYLPPYVSFPSWPDCIWGTDYGDISWLQLLVLGG